MVQSPYSSKDAYKEMQVANMQANSMTDYELNSTLIYGKYKSEVITRYSDYDTMTNFSGTFLQGDNKHNLSSKFATLKDDIITLDGNVTYKNTTGLEYYSSEIIYDKLKRIMRSDVPFTMIKNGNKIIGQSMIYNTLDEIIKAKKVKGWLNSN